MGKSGNLSTKHLRFIPQLDSFRFFAVMLVLVSHWTPKSNAYLPNGCLGVTFFFVISGYLISSNLIYLKKSIDGGSLPTDGGSLPTGKAFKIFYIRRTLRIFPLYFLVIFLLYLANKEIFEGKVLWYLTYLPNILFFRQKAWPGMLSHFWSLGVEEQFYLVWPLLIFTVKERWLKYLCPGIVLLSLAFKIWLFDRYNPFFSYNDLLTMYNFDAFGIGAILAYLPFDKTSFPAKIAKVPFMPDLVSA